MSTDTFRHVDSRCPQCDYKLDASTHVHGGEPSIPERGDISVCINCGQVLIYEDECRLRKIATRELGELMSDSAAWATVEKAQIFIRNRGRFQ